MPPWEIPIQYRLPAPSYTGSPSGWPTSYSWFLLIHCTIHCTNQNFVREHPMTTQTAFLRRDPMTIEPWRETCGQIRCLIEERDQAAAEVHYVEIENAKLHFHERTDEIYY